VAYKYVSEVAEKENSAILSCDALDKSTLALSTLVTPELVEAVHRDCCTFAVPGSDQLEKIRIRRFLEAAAPRLAAALQSRQIA